MKRFIPALAIALSAACFGANAADMSADEQAVMKQEDALVRAGIAHDTEALSRILDDRYVELTPYGRIRTKADLLSSAPPPAESMQDVRVLRIEVHGDSAIVLGTNQYRPTPTGQSTTFTFIDVFHKDGNAWRSIGSQMSKPIQE